MSGYEWESNKRAVIPVTVSERSITRVVLSAFCLSGAAALIYEVVWTRALSILLGSTVYALSTMLSTFMAGLALGAYLGGKIADRRSNHLLYFGSFELAIGFFGLLTVPLIYSLPPVYFWVYRNFHLKPGLFFSLQFLLCSAIMIIPTTLMGATFPLVSKRLTGGMSEMGRKVGDAYSMNTVGAIFGSLAGGFLLIPALGVSRTAIVAAALNVLSGAVILVLSRARGATRIATGSVLVILVTATILVSSNFRQTIGTFYYVGRFGSYEMLREYESMLNIVHDRDYAEGTVRAFIDNGLLTIQHGGKMEGTSPNDLANTLMLSTLPVAAYGKAPESMLVIGLGAGMTTWFSKQVAHAVDVVEINPGVLDVVKKHGFPGTLDGVNVIIDDARRYLFMTGKKYDVITAEPSVPSESMSANLYTREFYEIAAARLSKGGVFCQWFPAWTTTRRDTHIALKTFGSVFRYAYFWVVLESNDFLFVGSQEPIELSGDEIARRAAAFPVTLPPGAQWGPPMQAKHDPYAGLKLIRDPERVREIVEREDLPLMTDDRPFLEFAVTKNLLYGPDFKSYRE